MDAFVLFNLLESAWWMVMATTCIVCAQGRWKAVGRTSAGFFLIFAASDVIESRTGAWWTPWWLSVWKGACLAGLIACGTWAWHLRHPRM